MAAQNSPLKQPVWLLSRHMDLKAAKEGSWHFFLSKVGMREEEAAIIELAKFLVSCLGPSGLRRQSRSAKSLGWPCPTRSLPSSVAQQPLLKVIFRHFYSILHFLFWVAEAFLLAHIFMRTCLTHWALMTGPPSHPHFQKSHAHLGRLDAVRLSPRQTAAPLAAQPSPFWKNFFRLLFPFHKASVSLNFLVQRQAQWSLCLSLMLNHLPQEASAAAGVPSELSLFLPVSSSFSCLGAFLHHVLGLLSLPSPPKTSPSFGCPTKLPQFSSSREDLNISMYLC